ncbi:MAG: 3-phosphoshikimate 1-carboxyvinyltransferase [Clostridia bacterium]|nr:3-phosphoshikimate 1-carboxyvinyltransferase [Clostridia bacterium]
MKAIISPFKLSGTISAPPSKSMAHRYLIGSALSGQKCVLTGVDYSEDILATIDCLKALGVEITTCGDRVEVDPQNLFKVESPQLDCRESGSTLRFFIPIALCYGKSVTLRGRDRLFARPLSVYEELCSQHGFSLDKKPNSVTVCGKMSCGNYKVKGEVSSQFITGLIFALVQLNGNSTIEIIPPLNSRPYIDLTISALKAFGASVEFVSEYKIEIKPTNKNAYLGKIEGDYSNSAFLEVFNRIGSTVEITNLNPDSKQGDRVYGEYFDQLEVGAPTLDISNCPDLAPVLFALASLKNGATFTGTERLRIKESDRATAMKEELEKLGGKVTVGDDFVIVEKASLSYKGETINGHNDHRIVMAMTVVLSAIGGEIDGAEAVRKSYPRFFDDIVRLGAKVELI